MNKLIFAAGIVLLASAAPALAAPKPVPEPSSLSLLASGAAMLGGLKFFRGRKRKD